MCHVAHPDSARSPARPPQTHARTPGRPAACPAARAHTHMVGGLAAPHLRRPFFFSEEPYTHRALTIVTTAAIVMENQPADTKEHTCRRTEVCATHRGVQKEGLSC